MDFNIQLQVTDQELEEFPEEYLINTTNSPADWCDPHSLAAITHSPVEKFLRHVKQTLIQMEQTLIQPSVHSKQTLIYLSVPSNPVVVIP